MIGKRWKARTNFVLFLLPALVFYAVFALVPLAQGLWLSTTNWNGSAPWTPAQVPIDTFESQLLSKVSFADKQLLLKYYEKNSEAGTYQKRELYGIDRYRVLALVSASGVPNPDFTFVGLQNYLDLFTGKADPRFFPETYTESRFQSGSPLESAQAIPAQEWRDHLITRVTDPRQKELLNTAYVFDGRDYRLNTQLFPRTETDLQIALTEVPGLEDDWEALYQGAGDLGREGRVAELPAFLAPYLAKVEAAHHEAVQGVALETAEAEALKSILAQNWYQNRTKMGVLVFTVFFTFFNVLLVNVIALALALSLDTKIKTRNLLRTLFYIPNVLSMIIVAFVWQLMFTQFLPAVTGISTWIMNPDLAPWLTVLVATWQGVGYYTVIYLAGLQNVPQEITEVASLDGAHGWSKFTKITLPLLAPAVTICLFLSTAGALKTFDIIFALYPSNSTALGVDNIVVNIFYDAFRDKHAGPATAKAVLLMAVILAITALQMHFTKKKEVEL